MENNIKLSKDRAEQVLDHALDYFELLIDILNIQRKEEIEKIKKSHKGE